MATATIDGLKVEYVTRGSGPTLLMLAPGGFDASMDKWQSGAAWKGDPGHGIAYEGLRREWTE